MQLAAERGDDLGQRTVVTCAASAESLCQRPAVPALSALITLSVMSMRGLDVDRFLQDQVVLLLLGDLLDDAVGALEDRGQLFVAALVQVFAELAALALEVAVLLDQLALAAAALGFGQRRRFLVELLGGRLQARAQVVQFLSRLRTPARAWPAPPWPASARAGCARC